VQDVQTVLEFTISPFATSAEGLKDQLNKAVGEASDMEPAPALIADAGVVVDGVNSITNAINPIAAAWDPLLEKIKLFTKIVDGISEVWRKCRRSLRSSHAHGLFDSRCILMQKWHGPSCLLRKR
jgi:phage-related minor tail protein